MNFRVADRMISPLPDDPEFPAIPRLCLRVLHDGTFVVCWSDQEVQELQSGRHRLAADVATSEPITDYELNQLIDAGLVRDYDQQHVRLCTMPERVSGPSMAAWERSRVRSYYLNTTLPAVQQTDVVDLLDEVGLAGRFSVRTREDFVVLWKPNGKAFARFDDAEEARHLLADCCPEAFINTVVAFIETTPRS